MPKYRMKTKDFKQALKTFGIFSAQSLRKTSSITFSSTSSVFQIKSYNDSAFIMATPESQCIDSGGHPEYHLDPSALAGFSMSGKTVEFGWDTYPGTFVIGDGSVQAKLNISTGVPEDFPNFSNLTTSAKVPRGCLAAALKYATLPMSYYKTKKEMFPIRIYENQGKMCVASDDNCSLGELNVDCQLPQGFSIQVPNYVLQALYGEFQVSDDTLVTIAHQGYSYSLTNGYMEVWSSGLNEVITELDDAFSKQKMWNSFCKFDPKELAKSLKPLTSLLGQKDTSATVIVASISGVSKKMSLSLRHPTLGEAAVEEVAGISDVYNETGVPEVHVNMHPLAFSDYTTMIDSDIADMQCNNQAVLYTSQQSVGGFPARLRYMFPTVQV